jgi:hypothetical protein
MALIVVIVVLVVHAVLVGAGQLDSQGYFWAEQVCSRTIGLCHQPFLLGLSTGVISSVYLVSLILGKDKN